jgi:ATP-dependent DNA helicase DinG
VQDEGTGALVLFASWKQLNETHAAMPKDVIDHLLVQGNGMSKREILDRHRAAIDAGKRSAIFGTSSFEQGVDLPGNYLTLVVISKLQFSVPSHPVAQATREFFESKGLSYFDEIVVPQACRRLAQSTGRLIRTETDTGRILVADPRLSNTQYGRSMLKALPAYKLDFDWEPPNAANDSDHALPSSEAWHGIQPQPW